MDEQLYEQIKRYRSRQMPAQEREEFEIRLNSDPELAESATLWTAIQLGVQEKGDAQLDQQLMSIGRQLLQEEESAGLETQSGTEPKQPARRIAMPRWLYAAAAIMLLLLIALPFYQKFLAPGDTYASAETLYREHFDMRPVQTVRDAGTSNWQQAYTQKQFPVAISELKRLLADSAYNNKGEAYLYLGISQLASENPQSALEALQQVGSDDFLWDEAQWYEALAYLKLNDPNAAKPILQQLARQSSGDLHEKAEKLLHQLK